MTKIIIHGGFFSEASQDNNTKTAKQKSLQNIVKLAHEYLQTHTALETVVFAVALLEDDELFNAGIGSQIQKDGKIRMSASIMDSVTQKFSGVINIQNVKNPILVAQKLMNYEDRVLGGIEATDFAHNNGFTYFNTETPQRRLDFENKLAELTNTTNNQTPKPTSTVGCVALDNQGNIAAATSTGGKGFEIPGRISDSATTAGNFASKYAGVSCTGVGEDIVSVAVATKIVTRISDGKTIADAFKSTFEELKVIDGFAGAIGIDKNGTIFHQDSHPKMVFAYYENDKITVFE